MPNCTIILHRHSGTSGTKLKPSRFVADRLRPMLEGMVNGSSIHVIHDRIHSIDFKADMAGEMVALEQDRDSRSKWNRILNEWKRIDKKWYSIVKSQLSSADYGKGSDQINPLLFPEAALILEANRKRNRSVINHLNFYPFQSIVETTLCVAEIQLSEHAAMKQELKTAIGHLIKAKYALACSLLLKDIELANQINRIGQDVVVLRSMHHGYLGKLEEYDIPVYDLVSAVNLADLFKRHGIALKVEKEPVDTTFGEQTVAMICSGRIDYELLGTLAELELLFTTHMNTENLWEKPEGIEHAMALAIKSYEGFHEQLYGKNRELLLK